MLALFLARLPDELRFVLVDELVEVVIGLSAPGSSGVHEDFVVLLLDGGSLDPTRSPRLLATADILNVELVGPPVVIASKLRARMLQSEVIFNVLFTAV